MNIKGVIFDMDGTLLDSMPVWDELGHKYLQSVGCTPAEDLRERLRPLGLAETAQLFKEEYQLPYSVDQIMDQLNKLIEDYYFHSIPLKPGAAELLERLSQKGVKMALATATDRYLVEAALQRLGILHYFTCILTCGEVGCGKDQPLIYTRAMEMLQTRPEETIIFEDALHAARTAKNAGYTVVGVYDPSAARHEEALRAITDYFIYSFEDWEV